MQLQGVARIQEELLATEGQLAQIRQVAPNNPQIGALASRAAGLRQAIAAETGKVIGSGTSLTEGQIALIGRYARSVLILYDGDSAGVAAASRS
jgi:capsule polysaccharide export protein KpsE/RkpR